jgi:cytochrome c biogenesis protein CcmG, thiol:disulfide interchange protein DsbE
MSPSPSSDASTPPPGDAPAPGSAGDAPAPASPGGVASEPRRSSRRPRPVFLVVGLVLAAGLGVGLFTGVGTGPRSDRPVAGAPAPAFSLPALKGAGNVGVPTDGGATGRPAILLFFASWCGPCRNEVPALARTYRRQQASHSRLARVAVIGIDGNDSRGNALEFVHSSGITFPVGADTSGTVTQGLFSFTGFPDSVFVEGSGTIAAVHLGPLSASQFVSWERKLLPNG